MKVGLPGIAGFMEWDEESLFWYFVEEIAERAARLQEFAETTGDNALGELVGIALSVSNQEGEAFDIGVPGLASQLEWTVDTLFPYFATAIAERSQELRKLAAETKDEILSEMVCVAVTIALDQAKSERDGTESQLNRVKTTLQDAVAGLQAQMARIPLAAGDAVAV